MPRLNKLMSPGRGSDKVVSAEEAVALLRDGNTLCNAGFVGCGVPDELLRALGERFLSSGTPRDLTVLFAAGQGDGRERGLNRIAHEGLIKRVIGGHWGLIPKMGRLALENKIEAYNLPQGCISQLYRDIAAGKPGTLSRVGIGTFVDPRQDGGRINQRTSEEIVELMRVAGQEWLFYHAHPIDVAFIRGTTADPDGNLTMEHEALTLDGLAMAMAARNSGGLVIAQVERIAAAGSLAAREVYLPGVLVDCVVVSPAENHQQTYATDYSPVFSGEIRAPLSSLPPMLLDERKIIARRAAFELGANSLVNLGIGMPEGLAKVAAEESILDQVTMTAEPGIIGGIPASGLDFGAAVNATAIVDQNQQFDFYDGGGLDMACLGLAQCDKQGNINVSRFGPKLAGAGGFINISQNTSKVVFVGTFTCAGLEIAVESGNLKIIKEGRNKKFVDQVEQITFSGQEARVRGTEVLYVTERCVFRLHEQGLELTEIAPGIDLDRDILGQMDFTPVIRGPRPMAAELFFQSVMGLRERFSGRSIGERISYDDDQQLLFVDFENLRIREPEEITEIFETVVDRCKRVGRKVDVVVNYDGFDIHDDLLDDYTAMVKALVETHYRRVSRYTSNVFTRMMLGQSLQSRGVAPHLYSSKSGAVGYTRSDQE